MLALKINRFFTEQPIFWWTFEFLIFTEQMIFLIERYKLAIILLENEGNRLKINYNSENERINYSMA